MAHVWLRATPLAAQAANAKAQAKLLRQVPSALRLSGLRACWANHLWLQRFELLVTVMLARGRQLSAGIADALPSGLMAEAITLPSGLLAVVCEAIMKVTVRTACSDCRAKVGGHQNFHRVAGAEARGAGGRMGVARSFR
jgi:hypothetical protein